MLPSLLACLSDIGVERKQIHLNVFHNWHGAFRVKKPEIDAVCCNPWRQMVVAVDGTLSGCCIDYNNELRMGWSGTGLYDNWNGKTYQAFRRDMFVAKPASCRNCNWSGRQPFLKAGKDLCRRLLSGAIS